MQTGALEPELIFRSPSRWLITGVINLVSIRSGPSSMTCQKSSLLSSSQEMKSKHMVRKTHIRQRPVLRTQGVTQTPDFAPSVLSSYYHSSLGREQPVKFPDPDRPLKPKNGHTGRGAPAVTLIRTEGYAGRPASSARAPPSDLAQNVLPVL